MADAGASSSPGWSDRVAFSAEGDGFAYQPGRVLVGGERGLEEARRLLPESLGPEETVFPRRESGQFYLLRVGDDPLEIVHELRLEGVVAQPNHTFFAHSEGCCGPHPAQRWQMGLQGSPFYASPFYASPFYASPFYASPFYASPFYASPFYASPFYASPFYASPFYASPFYASELRATGRRRSSARPAEPPVAAPAAGAGGTGSPKIVVLDTGLADEGVRPPALQDIKCDAQHFENPDEDGEGHLDPAAGHGTFISGLIRQLAPGCVVAPERVLTTMGDGDEATIAGRIDDLALAGDVDILNLSFGGYVLERPHVLAAAVRRVQAAGTVVVSSAGNDATCRATYPAALPGVISVGAVGPSGPAPFTNYGRWVRACAPGVDLVAPFFDNFAGAQPAPAGGTDPDDFAGWARWSGTSFAAPVVVAALAREMRRSGVGAKEAVERVIDAPGLLRIPDLGTVVNVQ